jgi:hypothetical protein
VGGQKGGGEKFSCKVENQGKRLNNTEAERKVDEAKEKWKEDDIKMK